MLVFGRWSPCSETLVPQSVHQFFSTFANVPTFSRNNLNQTSRARFKSPHSNPRYSVFLKKIQLLTGIRAASASPQISDKALKRFLSIFSDRIFDSSVDRG